MPLSRTTRVQVLCNLGHFSCIFLYFERAVLTHKKELRFFPFCLSRCGPCTEVLGSTANPKTQINGDSDPPKSILEGRFPIGG